MKFFLILILSHFMVMAQAQVSAAIDDLNGLLQGESVLTHKKKHLVIEGFRDGAIVKRDAVNPLDLDPSTIAFHEEERVVAVSCFSEEDNCIQRERMPDGQRNFRKRVAFGVRDATHGKEVVAALRGLFDALQQ